MNSKKVKEEAKKQLSQGVLNVLGGVKKEWKHQKDNSPEGIYKRELRKDIRSIKEQRKIANSMPDGPQKETELARIDALKDRPEIALEYQKRDEESKAKKSAIWEARSRAGMGAVIGAGIGTIVAGPVGSFTGALIGTPVGLVAGAVEKKVGLTHLGPANEVKKELNNIVVSEIYKTNDRINKKNIKELANPNIKKSTKKTDDQANALSPTTKKPKELTGPKRKGPRI